MSSWTYEGREQTYVKHHVLRHYLHRLAFKIGQFQHGTTLNYIDGFSGPWDSATTDLADTSPSIAMTVLTTVRNQLQALSSSVPMNVRCMFVEREPGAFERLTDLCSQFAHIETERQQGEFEDHIPAAVRFARTGQRTFTFVFIDPTGWTGYGLQIIEPLLRVERCEVLINFMTKDIIRHIDDRRDHVCSTFEDLFGQKADLYRQRWAGLSGLEREDAIVSAYCERVAEVGGFDHCVSTIVAHPTRDRTHYHLVYATRSRNGLVTFRETERSSLRIQRTVRASAKRKRREEEGQYEMLNPELVDTSFLFDLQERHRSQARESVLAVLMSAAGKELRYETLIDIALHSMMVGESDLKSWIEDWKKAGRIRIVGLSGRQRVPKLSASHRVVFLQ